MCILAVCSTRVTSLKTQQGMGTNLLSVELGESLSELHKSVFYTGVVGQGQQGVGVAHGGHRTQARLPALLIPRDKGQRGPQSGTGRKKSRFGIYSQDGLL